MDAPKELTDRESEILALIAQGYTNKRIAFRLDISPNTVKSHVTTINNKLGAANRAQAVSLSSLKLEA